MDPFTARMLERARDRQRRVDERNGTASAAARSPLRSGAATNSEPGDFRQTEKSASPRRPAVERREDKENHPNVLHESTRSRLKQLGSLYSTDGETDLDAYEVDVTPRQSRPEPEPEPASRPLPAGSSSSSAGLRSRLAGLASQYQELESEEMQGFTPTGSRSRLVYDFAEPGRSPSPPRVVSAVTKPPSPEKMGSSAAPYRSASPVRCSPPPRPQPASPTGVPYAAPAREWSPDRQGSPHRQGSPARQPSPVRGRFVQERAAVFDRPVSPPPPDVDPTEMTLSDRRKLFEKGQPPKVIARFGTPVTPHMLRQHTAPEGPPPPAAAAAAESTRPRPPAMEEIRSRSPLRHTAPSGPPSPSRAIGESTFQAHRKLWESMNNDWRQNEIAQSSRQQRERELGFLANRWQHKPAELEHAAATGKPLEEMAPPAAAAPEKMAPPAAVAPSGGIPPPPPPPPASPPARRVGESEGGTSRARHSPVRQSPVRHPARHSPAQRSPSRLAEVLPDGQRSSGESASSPGSTVYRGSTAADESTVSYASGHSDAESLGAEILAMARANQPAPSLPTIDESSTDSSSDLSSMAACAAIDDVLDDMDNDPEEEPTPPKRTRKSILRRCTSHPTVSADSTAASITSGGSYSTAASTASSASTATASASAIASDTTATAPATATTSDASAATATATPTAASPTVAELIRVFQRPPLRPSGPPLHRRSAPCLGARPPASRVSTGAHPPASRASTGARPVVVCTSTPRRSVSAVSVGSADVTAVLPAMESGLELSLEDGGDGWSSGTLVEGGGGVDTASMCRSGGAVCGADGGIPAPTRLGTPSARPGDLTFNLTNASPARPDLTFDVTDLTPVSSDLGAVSWRGRSPRCWEEEVEHEGATHGGEAPGEPRSRLRQYLFGSPSDAMGQRSRLELTDTQSERQKDATALEGESDALETKLCQTRGKFGAPEAKLSAPKAKLSAPEAKPSAPEAKLLTPVQTAAEMTPELAPDSAHGAGEGSLDTSWPGGSPAGGDVAVSDIVSQLEAVCLRRGGGDGAMVPVCGSDGSRRIRGHRVLPPKQRQDSGVFRTPMACVRSPEQDQSLPSVVLDGDGAEVPLMHSVSFYRRQKPQEVQVTPVRPVTRNREVPSRYDEPSPSPSGHQQRGGASTQEIIKHLQKEATQQMTVMSQASRALNLCNATIEFTGSAEMVEAERLLLVATHRRQAALSEIQRLKTEGAMRQQGILRPASRGSLSVNSITLPVKTSFVREVAAGAANYVYHFVVLLRYRGQVIATQLLSSEDSIKGNAINFPNLVSFRELEAEFCVALEVYSLQAQREVLPHDAKYHIRKDRTKTPKKLLKQQSSLTSPAVQSPAGPGAVRATSFQLMGFIHLTARNLGNTAWALEKVPAQSPLDGGVLMTVTCHADCAVEERGFITVFDDVSGFGAWHRRWAALSGGRLSFWRYPEDEGRSPPSVEVDLRRCVTEKVGPVPRDICARQNTLLLVTVRQAKPDDDDSLVMQRRGSMTRIRHLLSLDGRDERQLWADKLNDTLANIRAWDPDAMQPHLDPSA